MPSNKLEAELHTFCGENDKSDLSNYKPVKAVCVGFF